MRSGAEGMCRALLMRGAAPLFCVYSTRIEAAPPPSLGGAGALCLKASTRWPPSPAPLAFRALTSHTPAPPPSPAGSRFAARFRRKCEPSSSAADALSSAAEPQELSSASA